MMSPRFTYVHAKKNESEKSNTAKKAVTTSCGVDSFVEFPAKHGSTASAFCKWLASDEAAGTVSRQESPLVVFLHVTPFLQIDGDRLSSMLNDQGFRAKPLIFIVLVSGADCGVNLKACNLIHLPQLARTKGLGGLSYWPYKISAAQRELRDAVVRIRRCFSRADDLPAFDDFRSAVLPEEVVINELCSALSKAIHGLENLAVPMKRDVAVLTGTAHQESPIDEDISDQYFGNGGYFHKNDAFFHLSRKAELCIQGLSGNEREEMQATLAAYFSNGVVDIEKLDMCLFSGVDVERCNKENLVSVGEMMDLLKTVAANVQHLAGSLRALRKGMENLEE